MTHKSATLSLHDALPILSTATINAMGATATPVDYGELYMALQTGIADGHENPITTMQANSIEEVQDYLILTGHTISSFTFTMAEASYEGLSEEQQEILMEAGELAAEYSFEIAEEEYNEALEVLTEGGMEVIEVDQDLFRPAGKVLAEQFHDDWGYLYERIQEVE